MEPGQTDTPPRLQEASSSPPLPGDYVSIISRFGGGLLADELWIYEPDHVNPDYDLVAQVELKRRLMRELWSGEAPLATVLRVDLSKVMAWGETGSAEVLLWADESDREDSWPIIVWSPEDSTIERLEMSFAEVIVRSLRGQIPEEQFFSPCNFSSDHSLKPWPRQ